MNTSGSYHYRLYFLACIYSLDKVKSRLKVPSEYFDRYKANIERRCAWMLTTTDREVAVCWGKLEVIRLFFLVVLSHSDGGARKGP